MSTTAGSRPSEQGIELGYKRGADVHIYTATESARMLTAPTQTGKARPNVVINANNVDETGLAK